ncbi:phosphoesterase [Dechloromonas sp. ZY10]|uniref:phosphoesterase n=1 Tax=Dechloromonas aquae TaxID=2664436 RepID=UPI00352738FC
MLDRPLIIYHADCLDGFAAAWSAWLHYRGAADFLPLHHGENWDASRCVGREVYILDFSFPPDRLQQMSSQARQVVQLDHHASARADWADRLHPLANGDTEYRSPTARLRVRFAEQKSGARLAWEYFHPEQPIPLLLQHIEDVDLWRFALPESRAIQRSLRLLAFDFPLWHDWICAAGTPDAPGYSDLLLRGQAIDSFFRCETERLANSSLLTPARLRGEPADPLQALRHGQPVLSDGGEHWHPIPGVAINCDGMFASELGHLLASRHQLPALIWQFAGDGMVRASLRSVGDCDVALIAKRYGGGGHCHAAGFRLPALHFFSEVLPVTRTS